MRVISLVTKAVFLMGTILAPSLSLSDINYLTKAETESDDQGLFIKLYRKKLSPIAITNLGSGNIYYFISRGGPLGRYDMEANEYLGGWPLTRWEHEYLEPEFLSRYRRVGLEFSGLSMSDKLPGCLSEHPLRYGDINSNGQNELVLFAGHDFIVFPPAQGETIFMARLALDDWESREETRRWYENHSPPGKVRDKDPQYQSKIAMAAVGHHQGQRYPGYRGYAKLYLGDFNEDGMHDILVWRKLYESRLRSDPVEGFKHLRDTLLHYSLTDEGYRRQDTEDAVIKGWLTKNELSWSDGFPSQSECAGEEGELIPEMHDPLLNDPEVLQ